MTSGSGAQILRLRGEAQHQEEELLEPSVVEDTVGQFHERERALVSLHRCL